MMLEPFFTLNEPQLAFLAALLGMILAAITLIACVAAVQYRKFRSREMELAFKDDLLDRGLSAGEIDLLWTGSSPGYLARGWQAIQNCRRSFAKSCRALAEGCGRALTRIVRAVAERGARRKQLDLAFKREMLDRGLSVGDVERLMAARQPGFLSFLADCGIWSMSFAAAACRWAWECIAAISQKLWDLSRARREEWRWDHS